MDASEVRDAFGRLERELAGGRAAALARIANRLERLIGSLRAARDRLDRLDGPCRSEALDDYGRLHAEAARYRWYLEVQRESLGLFRHDVLDRFYALPDRIVR